MHSFKQVIAVVALLTITAGLAADSRAILRSRCRPHPGVPRPCTLEGSWAVRIESADEQY